LRIGSEPYWRRKLRIVSEPKQRSKPKVMSEPWAVRKLEEQAGRK